MNQDHLLISILTLLKLNHVNQHFFIPFMAETLPLSHSAGVTGSWRDTLFVWCGKISIEATKNDDDDDDKTKDGKKDGDKTFITWTGSWVGVDSASADSSTELERSTSKNTFTVKGNQFSRSNSITLSTTEYLLDNGDGLGAHIKGMN